MTPRHDADAPTDLHPTRFEGEVWSCQRPEDPFAQVSSDGRCPKCRIASEARLRFWQEAARA